MRSSKFFSGGCGFGRLALAMVFFSLLVAASACNRSDRGPATQSNAAPTPASATSPETEAFCSTRSPDDATKLRIQTELEAFLAKRAAPPDSITIDVYFHVISRGPGPENGDVPDTMIQRQIDVLNSAFGPGGINSAFRFKLVRTDRTLDANWFMMTDGSAAEAAAKKKLGFKKKEALNIYTAGSGNWATFPHDVSTKPDLDGVVVKFATLPGGSAPSNNQGDIGTHEVGHWLGIFHTFQGGCSADNDLIKDTPAEALAATNDCPVGRDSCTGAQFPGRDAITNFMNYGSDQCRKEFTKEQASRMDAMYALYRAPGP